MESLNKHNFHLKLVFLVLFRHDSKAIYTFTKPLPSKSSFDKLAIEFDQNVMIKILIIWHDHWFSDKITKLRLSKFVLQHVQTRDCQIITYKFVHCFSGSFQGVLTFRDILKFAQDELS